MANNITLSYPSAFYHQFLDKNGKPLTGGKLYTYSAGTSTSIPTYKTIGDTSSANTNTNPIILDNAGVAHIVIETDKAYKFVLFDKNDSKIDEWDNVTGNIGGGGGGSEDIVVVGTPNEIDVSGSVIQGVKRYVVSLSNSVKITILQLIGLYNNVLNSLGNKADKVQGATAGNLAALDANGNLTDSGSKAADFKTKQTPVADPSASGNGLDFIDSISQNANGEITPHKKSVQDGTTAQKGVVKLSNAIDSTSVTEAATPKAVKDAYDELNNKIVARAVFLSQAEWAVQSQLPGDPAKVYYVENGTGEDAYTVYVWKESTSTYEEVDESSIDLDGYWHDSPTTTGSGNVVTNITLGNDGVPQVEKGMSAEPAFSVLPVNKGGTGKTTGKAATNNLFSDINNVNTDPDDTARIVFKYGSPSDSNGIFFARAITNLWNYIKSKISSVLGLSENGYTGNAATASAAASGSALETAINGKQTNVSNVNLIPGASAYGYSHLLSVNFGSGNKGRITFEIHCDFRYREDSEIIYCIFSTDNTGTFVATACHITKQSSRYKVCYKTTDTTGVYEIWLIDTVRAVSDTRRCSIVVSADECTYTRGSTTTQTLPSGLTDFNMYNIVKAGTGGTGSITTPVYVDSNGQVRECTQGSTLKSNTATLYIAGTHGDAHLPYYHVKDIKNGCVNYVHVKDIPSNTCSITIEAPALASSEEYDYVVVFDTFTNSNLVGSIDVENCKKAGRFENNVFVVDSMALTSGNPRYVPMIVVTGNVASSKWYERL